MKLTKLVKTLYKFVVKSKIPEEYSEPCQTSKMECVDGIRFEFEKVNAGWDNFFRWNTT